MTLDYDKALKGYPKYMSLEQMRIACHISKKTARLLLQNGLIPCKNTGKKTHTYQIKKSAVFEYLVQRDIVPEKYILPENSYAYTSVMSDIDYDPVIPADFSLFEEYPDVLSVQQAAALAGVTPATVKDWAKKKHIKAFIKNCTYHVPKLSLIEYLQSPRHKRNCIWKQNNFEKRRKNDTTVC
jgi:hypothetical protein